MNDETKTNENPTDVAQEDSVERRRRLLKASLGASAFPVLMSLSGRPLACTTGGKKTTRPSGFCSMKTATSYHGPKCNVGGCAPEYWTAQATWPCKKSKKCYQVLGYCNNSAYDNLTLIDALNCGSDFHKWCVAAYLNACNNTTAAAVCSQSDASDMWKGCGNGGTGYRPFTGSAGWDQTACLTFLKTTAYGYYHS